jgi:hypothetical protein
MLSVLLYSQRPADEVSTTGKIIQAEFHLSCPALVISRDHVIERIYRQSQSKSGPTHPLLKPRPASTPADFHDEASAESRAIGCKLYIYCAYRPHVQVLSNIEFID